MFSVLCQSTKQFSYQNVLKICFRCFRGHSAFFGKESLGFGVERGEINNGGGGKKMKKRSFGTTGVNCKQLFAVAMLRVHLSWHFQGFILSLRVAVLYLEISA